ncbi:MAG: CPBP family intramembrane metalloprotease [Anaerolineales bacterium]|nr:CPBP family intramembrane metalloprotease [Anaerolineales bacterium]
MSPGERRLRAGWRLLGQGMIFFALTLVLTIPAIFWQGLDFDVYSLLAQFITFLAVTISVFIARRLFDRRSIRSLGFTWNWQALADLAVGFFIAGLMMGLIFLIEWAAGWLKIEGFAWQQYSFTQIVKDIVYMLGIFILVGWQEELSSRGYQLQNLAQGLNLFWGVILSSAVFAILHLSNPSVSFMAVIGLFISGLFLAYGYVTTRLLWLPIGLHIGWNFFEGTVFGFEVSGVVGWPRLIYQTVEGNPLFTGGKFGPEAGIVLLPGVILGILMVYLYTRDREIHTSSS